VPDTVAHQQKLLRGIVVQWMSRDRAKVTRNLIVFEIAFFFAYRYGMTFSSDYPAPLWFPTRYCFAPCLSARGTRGDVHPGRASHSFSWYPFPTHRSGSCSLPLSMIP